MCAHALIRATLDAPEANNRRGSGPGEISSIRAAALDDRAVRDPKVYMRAVGRGILQHSTDSAAPAAALIRELDHRGRSRTDRSGCRRLRRNTLPLVASAAQADR